VQLACASKPGAIASVRRPQTDHAEQQERGRPSKGQGRTMDDRMERVEVAGKWHNAPSGTTPAEVIASWPVDSQKKQLDVNVERFGAERW
jgi:hypothetical protein